MTKIATRRGPMISAERQHRRNKENRGRELGLNLYTLGGGKHLRASDGDLGPRALSWLEQRVDDSTRTNEILDFVAPKLTLPEANMVTIEQDFRLFVLTIGFLRQLDNMMLVDNVLRRYSNFKAEKTQAVGWLSLEEAAQIARLINASLTSKAIVTLPTVAEVELFASLPYLAATRAGGFMWFTSQAHESGAGRFRYVYRREVEVGQHWLFIDTILNTSVVYKVLGG